MCMPQVWQTKDSFVYGLREQPKVVQKIVLVLWSLSGHEISAQTKIDIMQQAVAKCSKVSISCKEVQMPLLLDSGSEVSLICQAYFKEHLLPRIETPMGEKADSHAMFSLTVVNDGQLPIKMYTELDINFFALKVLNVGFLILEEPNSVLDRKHTKLPGLIGWNLILLAYQVFVGKYAGEIFNCFEFLGEVNPLLFSQLCLYYYAEIFKEHNLGVHSIYHQTSSGIQSTSSKSAHLAKKKSNMIG